MPLIRQTIPARKRKTSGFQGFHFSNLFPRMREVEAPNWHLKFRPRRSSSPALRFHRAWRHHGGQCAQQSAGRPDEYNVRGRRWIDCIARLGNGRAIGRARVNVFVVRAFLRMRSLLGDKRELAGQLAALEKELEQRLDVHEATIVTILQRVMDIIDPPALSSSAFQTANRISSLNLIEFGVPNRATRQAS